MNRAWKNDLVLGICFLCVGAVFGILCFYNYRLGDTSAMIKFALASTVFILYSIYTLGKCIYHSRPQNRDAYLKQTRAISNLDKDERNTAIRHRMGYIMHVLTILLLSILLLATVFIDLDLRLLLALTFFEVIGGALLLPFLDKRM